MDVRRKEGKKEGRKDMNAHIHKHACKQRLLEPYTHIRTHARTYVPTVHLISSTKRHQLLASVPMNASHFKEYSKFSNMDRYSERAYVFISCLEWKWICYVSTSRYVSYKMALWC